VTLEEKEDARTVVLPRYWVAEREVELKLASRSSKRGWLIGWRDI
jgi:hypothetical protein